MISQKTVTSPAEPHTKNCFLRTIPLPRSPTKKNVESYSRKGNNGDNKDGETSQTNSADGERKENGDDMNGRSTAYNTSGSSV